MTQSELHLDFSAIGDASNVLLLAPAMDPGDDQACTTLLTPADPAHENVLSVAFGDSPDDRLDVWRRYVGGRLPADTAVISVGDEHRSTEAVRTGSERLDEGVSIEFVTNPGDLTGLGMRITERVEEWADDRNRTVACFHSVTALLQYADTEQGYRFLHVLAGYFEQSGTVAHYHMDPGAHDPTVVNTVKGLMDAVVELDDDGEWAVTTRSPEVPPERGVQPGKS